MILETLCIDRGAETLTSKFLKHLTLLSILCILTVMLGMYSDSLEDDKMFYAILMVSTCLNGECKPDVVARYSEPTQVNMQECANKAAKMLEEGKEASCQLYPVLEYKEPSVSAAPRAGSKS